MKKVSGKILQQLGIVAGLCDEIQLTQNIDTLVGKNGRKISVGTAVKAMILNALGFSSRALYLTPQFYKERPVELLLGEDIQAEDLHDDCLGTALDALYEYGVTELFYQVSSKAVKTYGIEHQFVHLDTSTFSLHGNYDDQDPEAISITKGYSKDNNPDLKQVVLSLICSYKSTLPLWLEVLSGNSSDKKSFSKTIREYRNQFKQKQLPYFVADSALYTRAGISQLSDIHWITRVPEILGDAKKVISKTLISEMIPSTIDGYSFRSVKSSYADVDQRWLIVFSKKAYEKEYATLTKNIRKEAEKKEKEFWHLCNSPYACEADAQKAAKAFEKKMKYHKLECSVNSKNSYGKKGRPKPEAEVTQTKYFLTGSLVINSEAVSIEKSKKGFFIIASNELDEVKLSNDQLLSVYKSQGVSVERGFRFLKDPMFYAESLYLKSPKRIMALMMVMGLSLLVYSLAERKIRKALAETNTTISSQVGKPTGTPTLRWIFQVFEGILLFTSRDGPMEENQVVNLEDDHQLIIKLFGKHVEKMYFP